MGSLVIPNVGAIGSQQAGVAGDTILRILDPDDEVTVLWDMNDGSGANNPEGVRTYLLGDFDLGTPPVDLEMFESSGPGGSVSFRRHALTEMSFRIRATASTVDKLRAGAGALQRLLYNGGVMMLQLPGQATALYIDFVEGGTASALLDGRDLALFEVVRMLDTPKGLTLAVLRQPYLRIPELLPATNKLANATLLLDADGAGTPDGWTALGTPTSPGAHADDTSLEFTVDAAAEGYYQQTAATPGQVWTAQVESRVVSGTRDARLMLSFRDATTELAAVTVDTTSSTFGQRTITSAAAPALTTLARAHIISGAAGSGSGILGFRFAQLEIASAASAFRSGTSTMTIDPSV